jgi:winged helix DNA-binding protein
VRLERGHLAKQAPRSRLVDVVRDVCGLQAQLFSAAELGLSARVAGLRQQDVRDELWTRRSLVRAWTVRGTIHLIPAEDLPLWMGALGSRRYWESSVWLARHGLTGKEAAAIFETVIDSLDGLALTRAEIADAVVERLGAWTRRKISSMWGEMLAPATYMGKLCFGPSKGANVTFVRADQWIGGHWRAIEPDEAWRELVCRYLRAYGPSPLSGIARWFGLEPAEARALLARLGSDVVEREQGWLLASDRRATSRVRAASIRLLPQYDAYVMGCHPRESIVHDLARARVRTFRRGRWEGVAGVPVLLVDGVVSGVWQRTFRRDRIEIAVEPAMRLSAPQRAELGVEAERIGSFFGREVDLSVAKIA